MVEQASSLIQTPTEQSASTRQLLGTQTLPSAGGTPQGSASGARQRQTPVEPQFESERHVSLSCEWASQLAAFGRPREDTELGALGGFGSGVTSTAEVESPGGAVCPD